MTNMKPVITVAASPRLRLTVTDTSTPQRQIGVQLTRAAAAQLADLLDQAVRLDSKGMGRCAVFGEPVADSDAAPARATRGHRGSR